MHAKSMAQVGKRRARAVATGKGRMKKEEVKNVAKGEQK